MALNSSFAAWREADALAHAAERTAFQRALRYLDGSGPVPSQQEWEECKQLRRVAEDLFAGVVASWNPSRSTRGATAPLRA